MECKQYLSELYLDSSEPVGITKEKWKIIISEAINSETKMTYERRQSP